MPKSLSGKYALYGPKDTKEYIEADFKAKHGYAPFVMQWKGGGWVVGPLPVDAELQGGETQVTGGGLDDE